MSSHVARERQAAGLLTLRLRARPPIRRPGSKRPVVSCGGLVMSLNDSVVALSRLTACEEGTIHDVQHHPAGRTERLLGLGVRPGARVRVLQTFPAIVFLCDQTELAVERAIGDLIFVGSKGE